MEKEEIIAETLCGDKIKIEGDGFLQLTPRGKMFFDYPSEVRNFADVINNAKLLFTMHPTPWRIKSDGLDGYVVDANGKHIFGGEYGEGYVSEEDKEIVALVDVINSLWVYMKGEK